MKRTYLLAHLSLPMLFALSGLIMSLRREALTSELLFIHLAWVFLFYAAPHLLWAVLCSVVQPVLFVWHVGFISSSCALVLVAALSIWGIRDPSGLPYQWFLYWPLAGLSLVVVVIGWFLTGRRHAKV
ncbi:MAG: hypothetical protein WBK51_13945 [Polaromonas sp.]